MSQISIFEIQADLCRCMSNATRIEIVHVLRDGPQRVSDLVQIIGRPQSMISRHLGVLRQGGVVSSQHHGREIVYQVANPKIVRICDLMREVLMEEATRRSKLVDNLQDKPLQ